MTTLHITKPIDDVIEKALTAHLLAGHWPKVEYGGVGLRSYSLYPMIDVRRLYKSSANEWLIAKGEAYGIFTRRRNATLLGQLEEFLSRPPVTTRDIKVGSMVKLTVLPVLSKKYREATVDMCHNPEFEMIMEGDVKEQDGYFGEHGSFYHKELVMLLVDGVWRPIELTKEEENFPPIE